MTPRSDARDGPLPDAPVAPGRVLRVKLGYNPNSSSIGSAIPTFLGLAAAAGGLAVVLLHLTDSVASIVRRDARASGSPTAPAASRDGHDHAEQAEPEER